MSSPPENILILGAGELGTPVLSSLASHPSLGTSKLSVLLRIQTIRTQDAAKRATLDKLSAQNISFVAGDISNDSEETLTRTFAPFTTVVGCTGMTAPVGTQVKLAKAIIKAGVQRYIPWQFGVDYDAIGREAAGGLFCEQLDVRDILRSQQTGNWVIVSTGMFMSFLFEEFFGVVQKGGDGERRTVRALGSWQNKLTITAVEDIGRMVAEIVLVRKEIKNRAVFIAGDTVTYAQLADTIQAVEGMDVKREEWTVPYLQEELARDPENGIKKYRLMFAQGTGVAWDPQETLNAVVFIRLKSVGEWLRTEINVL